MALPVVVTVSDDEPHAVTDAVPALDAVAFGDAEAESVGEKVTLFVGVDECVTEPQLDADGVDVTESELVTLVDADAEDELDAQTEMVLVALAEAVLLSASVAVAPGEKV